MTRTNSARPGAAVALALIASLFLLRPSPATAAIDVAANAPAAVAYTEAVQPGTASSAQSDVPRIELGAGQVLEIYNTMMFNQDETPVCSFELTVRNDGESDIRLDDYYFHVKTRSGNSLDFRPLPEDADRPIIPAGTSGSYRFYGNVPAGVGAADLVLEVNRWDFNAASLHIPLGTVALSEAPDRQGGHEAEISAKTAKVSLALTGTAEKNLGDRQEITWSVTVRNIDLVPVVLPQWAFWLRDARHSLFAMQPDRGTEGVTVQPGEEIIFNLTATVPAESGVSDAGLVLTRTVAAAVESAKALHVPVASLAAPDDGNRPAGERTRTFAAMDGTFAATLDSLQRWPWDERDILTAAITLTNISGEAEAVPPLGGAFRAEGTEEWAAQLVRTDSFRLLQPGQSTRLFLQARVDPEEAVPSWDISLTETVDTDGQTYAVHRAEWSEQIPDAAREVTAGQATDMAGTGGEWSYTVTAPLIYESPTSRIAAVRVDAENLDKRYNPVSRWVAQFVTEEGTVYPAEVEATEQRVIPRGTASLTAWAVLPQGADTDGLKLILGLGVTGGELSGYADTPDSFLEATVFQLPETSAQPTDNVTEFALYPYTLTIDAVSPPYWAPIDRKSSFQFSFSFDYTLLEDLSVVSELTNRRVIVEVLDGHGEEIHEEAYALEPVSSDTPGLEIGSDTEEWTVEIDSLSIGIDKYTVNIYEEFLPGYRRLIGSTTSDWLAP